MSKIDGSYFVEELVMLVGDSLSEKLHSFNENRSILFKVCSS